MQQTQTAQISTAADANVVVQAVLAMAHRHLMTEHRSHGSLGVADGQLDDHRGAVIERIGTQSDQVTIEVLFELVILADPVDPRLVLAEV